MIYYFVDMKDKKTRISERKVIYQPGVKQASKLSSLLSSSVNNISQTYIHSETGKKIHMRKHESFWED